MSDVIPVNSLRRDQLAIGLVSAMLVALEIVWTRIFPAEFFYSFAFLTVSLAVLGLGLGAQARRLGLERRHLLGLFGGLRLAVVDLGAPRGHRRRGSSG